MLQVPLLQLMEAGIVIGPTFCVNREIQRGEIVLFIWR